MRLLRLFLARYSQFFLCFIFRSYIIWAKQWNLFLIKLNLYATEQRMHSLNFIYFIYFSIFNDNQVLVANCIYLITLLIGKLTFEVCE